MASFRNSMVLITAVWCFNWLLNLLTALSGGVRECVLFIFYCLSLAEAFELIGGPFVGAKILIVPAIF